MDNLRPGVIFRSARSYPVGCGTNSRTAAPHFGFQPLSYFLGKSTFHVEQWQPRRGMLLREGSESLAQDEWGLWENPSLLYWTLASLELSQWQMVLFQSHGLSWRIGFLQDERFVIKETIYLSSFLEALYHLVTGLVVYLGQFSFLPHRTA